MTKPLKRKRGRPLTGERRVRLYGNGPHVATSTRNFLRLMGPLHGLPMGRVIDALVALSASQGITFKLPLKGQQWKMMSRFNKQETTT